MKVVVDGAHAALVPQAVPPNQTPYQSCERLDGGRIVFVRLKFEAVTAVVTLKPGSHASEEELLAHCKAHLSGFESPKAVCFVEQFPLTATGRIQKNQLRARFVDLYAEAPAR